MANGILAVCFDYSPTNADEFHDWYDLEHVPERQAIDGFGRCERWLGADEPNYAAATYDLDSVDVLQAPAYQAIGYDNASPWTKRMVGQLTRLMRFEGEQLTPGSPDAPAGAGIEQQQAAAAADFQARRIAAIALRARVRGRDAASDPPEPYEKVLLAAVRLIIGHRRPT